MTTPFNETPIRVPIPPSNFPNHGGAPIPRDPVGAIMHHIVGTLPGCDATFKNPDTGYATNYGIGSVDGRGGGEWQIHEYVPADAQAWGNGNTHLNEEGVSIEHENNLALGIAGKPRDEVHELSARFLASLARRFDWRIGGKLQLVARDFPNHDFYGKRVPGFGTEFNVITHRSVALKDCPKDLDFGWIVARGNQILDGADSAAEPEGIDMSQITYVERVYRAGDGSLKFDGEWMIVGRDLGVHETDPNQDGYRFALKADQAVAMQWAKLYGHGEPNQFGERQPIRLERDAFVKLQAYARKQAAEYRRTEQANLVAALAAASA